MFPNTYLNPRSQLYDATSPLECLRTIASSMMNPNAARLCKDEDMKFGACDVSQAYFYAPEMRPSYIEIIDDYYEEGDGQRANIVIMYEYVVRGYWISTMKIFTPHFPPQGETYENIYI